MDSGDGILVAFHEPLNLFLDDHLGAVVALPTNTISIDTAFREDSRCVRRMIATVDAWTFWTSVVIFPVCVDDDFLRC